MGEHLPVRPGDHSTSLSETDHPTRNLINGKNQSQDDEDLPAVPDDVEISNKLHLLYEHMEGTHGVRRALQLHSKFCIFFDSMGPKGGTDQKLAVHRWENTVLDQVKFTD